jgi:hypothetical protein
MFSGASHTISYLVRLNAKKDLDLIFEYSSWVLECNASEAVTV